MHAGGDMMDQDKMVCEWTIAMMTIEKYGFTTECKKEITTKRKDYKNFKYCPYCGRWIREVK